MPSGHSKIGFSGLHGWGPCPGQPAMCEGMPRKTSDASALGTGAHTVAEACLLQGRNAEDFKGQMVGDNRHPKNFEVDQNMIDAVNVYVATVFGWANGNGILVEQKFHLDWLHEALWGTNDAMCIWPGQLLDVWDYKHGVGILVDIVKHIQPRNEFELKTFNIFGCVPNYQQMGYALGGLGKDNTHNIPEVRMTIVQPRAREHHPDGVVRSITLKTELLYKWAYEVLKPAAELACTPDAPLVPGDWCRTSFCPAAKAPNAVCSAVRDLSYRSALLDFNTLPAVVNHSNLPAVGKMTNEEMGRIVSMAPMIIYFLKEVKETLQGKADRGEETPHCKLVAGNNSRSWNPGTEKFIIDYAQQLGINPYTKPELLSVAAFETLATKAGSKKGFIGVCGHLIKKTAGQNRITSEASAGTPVKPSVITDFNGM